MKKLSFAVALGLLICAGTSRADEALRRVQQALHDQGFYYGQIDGTPGDETTHAINRYQIRNGLAVTGQLNDETIRSINHAGGASAPKSGVSSAPSGKITGDNPRTGNGSAADEDRRYAQGDAPAPTPRDSRARLPSAPTAKPPRSRRRGHG